MPMRLTPRHKPMPLPTRCCHRSPTCGGVTSDADFGGRCSPRAFPQHAGVTGQVLMDRHAPEACATWRGANRRSAVARWHGIDRLAYGDAAPRDHRRRQLTIAGALLQHLGLNTYRPTWPRTPRWRGSRSCFRRRAATSTFTTATSCSTNARCWRTAPAGDVDRALLADSGAQIRSPSSNLFLGSGLFDWQAMDSARAAVSLTATSAAAPACRWCARWPMPTALGAARRAPQRSRRAHGTLGAARALRLDREIGSLAGRVSRPHGVGLGVGPVAVSRDAWHATCTNACLHG